MWSMGALLNDDDRALDAVHDVPFAQQKLGKLGTVLAGDECNLRHDRSSLFRSLFVLLVRSTDSGVIGLPIYRRCFQDRPRPKGESVYPHD
jgi:hypothetical protein